MGGGGEIGAGGKPLGCAGGCRQPSSTGGPAAQLERGRRAGPPPQPRGRARRPGTRLLPRPCGIRPAIRAGAAQGLSSATAAPRRRSRRSEGARRNPGPAREACNPRPPSWRGERSSGPAKASPRPSRSPQSGAAKPRQPAVSGRREPRRRRPPPRRASGKAFSFQRERQRQEADPLGGGAARGRDRRSARRIEHRTLGLEGTLEIF